MVGYALLSQLDKDGDGSISREEFKAATRNNPQLLECFGRLFGVEDEEGKAARETDPYANLDRLRVERVEKLLSGDDGGAKVCDPSPAASRLVICPLTHRCIAIASMCRALHGFPSHPIEARVLQRYAR